MKDYEIIYINLFYKKAEPTTKVFDVLVKMDGRYESMNVVVDLANERHPWYITGNKKFESMNPSELSDFIDKMKNSETYYMSGDEYEIINYSIYRIKDEKRISVAVAHNGGMFSVVDIPMNIDDNLSIYTDWEQLSSRDDTLAFLEEFQDFVEHN